jgi:hypothetical protein
MWARLKDGHVLCQAANKLAANACPKVNSSAMPFKQMENITAFINACRNVFKVPEHELFETVDLYEEKDLGCFVTCICSLGRVVAAAPRVFAAILLDVAAEALCQGQADQLLADAVHQHDLDREAAQHGDVRHDIREVNPINNQNQHRLYIHRNIDKHSFLMPYY